jgi:4-diphosphocytidyl-2-C-methyl-D-erythritol kinase
MTLTARLRAFAKLNLGLRVLYKRPDGYHELRTVFQTASLADRIRIDFTRARQTRIVIEGAPEIPDNLIEKASRFALDAMRIHADIKFNLKKIIPTGAGLGGGSSDAAAVLLALPALAGKPIPADRLLAIATQLGSDVPFFLHGGRALGLGRGEELYPLPDQRDAHVLLIAPRIHSSTADAYRDLSRKLTSIPLQNKLFSFQQELWHGSGAMHSNDFEAVVFARHPELKRIKSRLLRAGAKSASMTGSGSSIFGLFDDQALFSRAKDSFPNERVFPLSFLSRAAYRSAYHGSLARALRSQTSTETDKSLWPPRSVHA